MEGARAHRAAWASHMVGVDSAFKLSKRKKKSQVVEIVLMVLISFNGMGFSQEPKNFGFQAPST